MLSWRAVRAQAFVDWRMDLLTEVAATRLMEDCMTGIMRVGLLSAPAVACWGREPTLTTCPGPKL